MWNYVALPLHWTYVVFPLDHSIVLSVSGVSSLDRIIFNRFMKFYKSGLESKSILVSHIFNESSSFAYTFIGYNLRFGHTHLKNVNISCRFLE